MRDKGPPQIMQTPRLDADIALLLLGDSKHRFIKTSLHAAPAGYRCHPSGRENQVAVGFACTPAISSRASGGNGITWGRVFLVREPGMLHMVWSSFSLARAIPATSFSRAPVSSNSRSIAANGRGAFSERGASTVSHACQSQRISSSLSTRWRAVALAGRGNPVHGLICTRRFFCSQPKKLLKAA
jgi:hypothetical protein